MTDPMQRPFHSLLVRSFDIVEDVSSFMGPTALHGHVSIDQKECCEKPFASIDDDEFKVRPEVGFDFIRHLLNTESC